MYVPVQFSGCSSADNETLYKLLVHVLVLVDSVVQITDNWFGAPLSALALQFKVEMRS